MTPVATIFKIFTTYSEVMKYESEVIKELEYNLVNYEVETWLDWAWQQYKVEIKIYGIRQCKC